MRDIKNFADRRQGAWCIHCSNSSKGSRDHVPSKVFLDEPYPDNLPLVDICASCNQGFSLDEQYVACLLECAACGSANPEELLRPKIQRILADATNLRQRLESAQQVTETPDNGKGVVWMPEGNRVRNVLLKLARGHAMFELNEPMFDEPDALSFVPIHTLSDRARSSFESDSRNGTSGWPEVGSRAMQRLFTQADVIDGWINVQPHRYRYQVSWDGSISVRIVLRDYLAAEVIWNT